MHTYKGGEKNQKKKSWGSVPKKSVLRERKALKKKSMMAYSFIFFYTLGTFFLYSSVLIALGMCLCV